MTTKESRRQRELFCCHYARLGDVTEAARQAGYPAETAAEEGAEILRKLSYRRLVEQYRSVLHSGTTSVVYAGLERLAFGRTNDAIRLLLSEETLSPEQLQQMDLFPVTSVKRDKNGGIEIHFCDRLKALTALYEYSGDAENKTAAQSLLAALSGGEELEDHAV